MQNGQRHCERASTCLSFFSAFAAVYFRSPSFFSGFFVLFIRTNNNLQLHFNGKYTIPRKIFNSISSIKVSVCVRRCRCECVCLHSIKASLHFDRNLLAPSLSLKTFRMLLKPFVRIDLRRTIECVN